MKVFLVWSGNRSFEIAKALNDWLRRVIQAVKPFFSHEIDKGAKWANEIDAALEGTRFGIVCLTPDNLSSTWIHYETGALSKTKDALIWTYLSGLSKGDVPQPLGKFQHTLATKEETWKLLRTINKHLNEVGGESLPEQILEDNFILFWPSLEEKLKTAMNVGNDETHIEAVPRKQEAMLEEILELLRSQQRLWSRIEDRVVTVRTKNVARVTFRIPPEPVIDGGTTTVNAVAERCARVFGELFDANISQAPCDDAAGGVEMQIEFSPPIERHMLTIGLDTLQQVSGWRPKDFSMSKV